MGFIVAKKTIGGMAESKKRVKSDLLELSLSCNAASAALYGFMIGSWEVGRDPIGVARVLVADDCGLSNEV